MRDLCLNPSHAVPYKSVKMEKENFEPDHVESLFHINDRYIWLEGAVSI